MKQLLLTSLLAAFLLGCKKDKTPLPEPEPVDYSGNFFCEVSYDYSYPNQNSDKQYDFVFPLTMDADSIYFAGYSFSTSSFNMVTGTGSDTLHPSGSATVILTAFNEFNSIQFYALYPSQLAGPTTTTFIQGNRTELEPTSAATTPLEMISGDYLLFQQVFENYNGIDTETTAPSYVSYDANLEKIYVDGVGRPFPLCHSHYTASYNYSQGWVEEFNTELYWTHDSLYYHYHLTQGQQWPPDDTTHYHLQGHRL